MLLQKHLKMVWTSVYVCMYVCMYVTASWVLSGTHAAGTYAPTVTATLQCYSSELKNACSEL